MPSLLDGSVQRAIIGQFTRGGLPKAGLRKDPRNLIRILARRDDMPA